jgi:hypothetical protein
MQRDLRFGFRPGDGPIFGLCLIWVLQACHASMIKLQQIHVPAAALAVSLFVGKPAYVGETSSAESILRGG